MSSLPDKQTGRPLRGFIKFDLLLWGLTTTEHEWVIWLDADALITNDEIRFEDLLSAPISDFDEGHRGEGVITGYDHNGHHTTFIAAQNTQRVKEYFMACNGMGRRLFIDHPLHEMEAMFYFSMRPPYRRLLGYQSVKKQCAILTAEYEKYGNPPWLAKQYAWEPGDFVLHLSALPYERRVQLATFYSNPANHHLKPPKAFTPEQIAWLNAKRAEIGEEALRPIVAELEGRA